MIEVRISIDATPPPAEVFAFWSDWANNPRWQLGMDSCTWTSERPMAIGSTYDQRATFLGRPIVSKFEVVEYEPDAMVRIVTTESTLPLDITRRVEPGPNDGTTLTAVIKGNPEGPMRLFNPLTRHMVARNITKDYDRLKVLLDSGRFRRTD